MPEGVRYVWSVDVGGEFVELDGKFTNYSRGACDPAAGCPPPRDPGRQPFAVLGNCSGSGDDACEEVGVVEAAFSPADGTVTIPVPLKTLGARAGSKIAPYTSDLASRLGGTIVAFTAASSSSGSPADGLTVEKTFIVPGAKKKK